MSAATATYEIEGSTQAGRVTKTDSSGGFVRYVVRDGRCSCPDSVYRAHECKHIRMFAEAESTGVQPDAPQAPAPAPTAPTAKGEEDTADHHTTATRYGKGRLYLLSRSIGGPHKETLSMVRLGGEFLLTRAVDGTWLQQWRVTAADLLTLRTRWRREGWR